MRITTARALDVLSKSGETFLKVFEHGSLEVEVYKPLKIDLQSPHLKDEVYVIIEGNGNFTLGDTGQPVGRGDVLFVPAGLPHHFHDFSDDFCTWVFFFGPKGGEVVAQAVDQAGEK